ncbi:MAG: NUDIX hydrolase, partial [Mesorhizobium sp.]
LVDEPELAALLESIAPELAHF